jgi:uncharacterized repeat protein (TIGR02543 family)
MHRKYFCLKIACLAVFLSCQKADDEEFSALSLTEFVVSFDSNGGSAVPPQTIKEGEKATKPDNPTRDEYTFVAWYKETELANEWKFDADVVTADMVLYARWIANDYVLTTEEMRLYHRMMEYRKEKGLSEIPISKSLTYVAHAHVKDLQENHIRGTECNMHSWYEKGDWTPCCYTADHAQAACMWRKPRELTSYTGNGYEIAHWHSAAATPESALSGWQRSPGHHAVIVNEDNWKNLTWNAIGIGIHRNFAVVWFGREFDNS